MKFETKTRLGTSMALAAVAMALPAAASAQAYPAPMSEREVQALPPEYRTGPAVADYSEVTVDENGVETITRTRRIESTAPYPAQYEYESEAYDYRYAPQPAHGYAPAASVFQREEWIAECERRTRGHGDREKGGIIGGLLGAITGGIIGNRVAGAGERLGGTLIGAGVGGIAGVVLGSLIGGGRNDRGEYDCEAALDGYLTQYGHPGTHRVATRVIPPQHYAPAYAPAYAPPAHYGHYSYGYAPAYQYSYAAPQQVVYVPIEYEVPQRVIVRETVREEVIPGATRYIPPPPRPVAEPIYIKDPQPRYIKGE